HARLDDGVEIVGTRYTAGARPELLVILRAPGPASADLHFTVRSKVVAKAWLSSTMLDPVEREVGLPLPIAPSRWKAGFLYADHVPIRKRPGTEVFRGALASRGRSKPGAPIDLLTLH